VVRLVRETNRVSVVDRTPKDTQDSMALSQQLDSNFDDEEAAYFCHNINEIIQHQMRSYN
jgi:hypothetical protein